MPTPDPTMPTPDPTKAVQKQDRWSMQLPVTALAVMLLYWCIVAENLRVSVILFSVIIIAAVAIASAVMFLLRLAELRWRSALSALTSAVIIGGGIAVIPYTIEPVQNIDFALHRAKYGKIVESWRTKKSEFTPLRLVVDSVDRSVFLTNIFDSIVFDETDAIERDPDDFSGIWPCAVPEFANGIMLIGKGKKFVRALGDHFYFVEEIT